MSNANVASAGNRVRSSSEVGPRIIVALDYANAQQAKALLVQLDPELCRVKVGKQLFTVAGPALIADIQALGFDVFLDLKFHDIPNTVAGACKAAAELGVWMLNVHASGGRRMLEAARAAVPIGAARLIAVTVLTSTTAEELAETGLNRSLEEQVDFMAELTRECGLDGVVCSPLESARLRTLCGSGFQLVTPGVRPAGAELSDQRRVMTPADALKVGSNFLVIGRPITGAADPQLALQQIYASLGNGPADS